LTDLDLFIEKDMRGGISMGSKWYAKANNPRATDYDPTKPNKLIMYFDANNLYGWATSLPLPKGGFKWKRVMPTEEQIMKLKENSRIGWILEVDLDYPEEHHESHNSYPLAPEKKAIGVEQMSKYQKRMMDDWGWTSRKARNWCSHWRIKALKYVVHFKNLQFYLRQGMHLKNVYWVIEFDQERWMEPYIRMNTEFRKEAKSNFETNFYKLMNNSVFGKTMGNLRNHVDVKIVRSWETDKIRRLVASPLYSRSEIFGNNLLCIHMHKMRLLLDKLIYT